MAEHIKASILVVDDEKDTTDLLRYQLESARFKVATLNNPLKVMAAMHESEPDLILLDVMMPELSGFQLCHMIKADQRWQNIPIILLTARGESEDRIKGLETGVDDYITKPFNTRELILRVKAVLKRSLEPRKGANRELKIGPIVADKDLREARINDKPVFLTVTEFKLLQLLIENRNRVLTREDLLLQVWNYEASTETRTVDTHVRRLREKLGPASHLIETVRGVGYKMCEPTGNE